MSKFTAFDVLTIQLHSLGKLRLKAIQPGQLREVRLGTVKLLAVKSLLWARSTSKCTLGRPVPQTSRH
jgi:hypothetical protein